MLDVEVKGLCINRAGMKRAHEMAGSTHAVVRCKSNQIKPAMHTDLSHRVPIKSASHQPPIKSASAPSSPASLEG